ncbi:hypothetical protein M434DRAFT_67275 [Hypoxylon sp. CO27-5]|nr:hypothetical protein M434DRAFT_67275 [Hypoxylon sp. CO27-5]
MLSGYRISLHPLRKYPGPFLAKLSDCYGGFYASLGCLPRITWQDHLKYGPVMRHGPDRLVFNSVAALKDIYQNDRLTKSRVYLVTQRAPNVYSLFNATDRQMHRAKRKLIGSAVNEHSMRGFEPIMQGQIDIFLNQILLASMTSDVVDMSELSKRLGMDVAGLLAFGYNLNLLTDPANRKLISTIGNGNWRFNTCMQFPLLKKLRIDTIMAILNYLFGGGKDFFRLLKKMIQYRLAESRDAKHDLYSFVAHAMTPSAEEKLSLSDIWSEAFFFFPAAGDTTATTISALFFYLSRYPEHYDELAKEIRDTFQSGDDIRGGPQLSSCKYLRACIDEALRMAPPVSGTLWREKASDDDSSQGPLIIDGHIIPQGIKVGVNIFALHHNEDYFADPFTFNPTRWLSSEFPEENRKLMRDAFIPFSTGARSCAGKAMAYLQASLVVAKTLWSYDFKADPEDLDETGSHAKEYRLYDVFSSTHNGPNLIFSPRIIN